MKIAGTVRNLPTGDVELVVLGDINEAKTLLEYITKALPAGEVTSFTTSTIDLEIDPKTFSIKH